MLSVEEIKHLYVDKQYSSPRIAMLDGRSKVTICSILKANGVTIRSHKEAKALIQFTNWTAAKIEVMKSMWLEGKTAPEIAMVLGMTSDAIYDKRHKLGLPTRQRRVSATNDMSGQYYGPVNRGPAVLPPQRPGWPTLEQLRAGHARVAAR